MVPRAITTNAGIPTTVWTWGGNDPFGVNAIAMNYNVRLPGQYFDLETRIHYNYFRDYDSSTGWYVQSDPIGLKRGFNMFGYLGNSPLKYYDLFGLDRWEDDPTFKRIPNDDKKIIRLICEAEQDGGLSNLTNQRAKRFGRYDDNVAAAERFFEMYKGRYRDYPPYSQDDLNMGQVIFKIFRKATGQPGSGSQDAEFVGKWGSIGALYYRENQGLSKLCGCDK